MAGRVPAIVAFTFCVLRATGIGMIHAQLRWLRLYARQSGKKILKALNSRATVTGYWKNAPKLCFKPFPIINGP